MNDQVAFVQFAEIDLSAMPLRVIKPTARMGCETSEQFSRGQNDEVRVGETKAARERAENEIDLL